mgnify:CR=1 FL=1
MNFINIINYLLPLVARFPHFPVANVQYNRNFVEVIKQSLEIQQQLNKAISPFEITDSLQLRLSYIDGQAYKTDSVKLAALEQKISTNIHTLNNCLSGFSDLHNDLKKLKQQTKFVTLAKQLIQASPFIYNGEGQAMASLQLDSFSFNSFEPSQIHAFYSDHFTLHLAPILTHISNEKGLGEVHKITRNTLKHFIEKEVVPATRYYSDDNKIASENTLIMEELPQILTPLRGAIGGDCSIMSVPYYGLLDKARVFWLIRSDSENQQPAGYVLMVEVQIDGETMPMIITINGPTIKTVDCWMVFKQIATLYNNEKILVADWIRQSFLINSEQIRQSLNGFDKKKVNVTLPEAWDDIPWGGSFEDYYKSSYLNQACLFDTNNITTQITQQFPAISKNLYPHFSASEDTTQNDDIKSVSLTSRAILAYYFLPLLNDDETRQRVENCLDVNRQQSKDIQLLIDLYQHRSFTVDDFIRLKNSFDFDLNDLLDLEVHFYSHLVKPLHDQLKDEFDSHIWAKFCSKAFIKLKSLLESYPDNDDLKDELASIPDEFIPDYWQTVQPFFYLNGSDYPDHYMLRRFIKHFHSYGSIEQLLTFLNEEPETFEGIMAHDSRWFAFFKRAQELMPDNPEFIKAVDHLYYHSSLNTQKNYVSHEIADIFNYGLQLCKQDPHKWREDIITSRLGDDYFLDDFKMRTAETLT